MDPGAAPWRDAPVLAPFLLHNGKEPARQKTVARLVWDDTALYVLFVCEDPNVWATLAKHQAPLYREEVVEIFLDPDGDGRQYFEFEISPRNFHMCAVIENNGAVPPRFRSVRALDPEGLISRVAVDGSLNDPSDTDRRWTVFAKIPFSYLGVAAPKPGEVWRANLYRIDHGAAAEYSCWSPTLSERPNFHIPRRFGKIVFER